MLIDLRKCKTKFNPRLLKIGTNVEMEHTTSRTKAQKIARQHMCEMGEGYYPALVALEKKLAKKRR
jgi:hypothetical protein